MAEYYIVVEKDNGTFNILDNNSYTLSKDNKSPKDYIAKGVDGSVFAIKVMKGVGGNNSFTVGIETYSLDLDKNFKPKSYDMQVYDSASFDEMNKAFATSANNNNNNAHPGATVTVAPNNNNPTNSATAASAANVAQNITSQQPPPLTAPGISATVNANTNNYNNNNANQQTNQTIPPPTTSANAASVNATAAKPPPPPPPSKKRVKDQFMNNRTDPLLLSVDDMNSNHELRDFVSVPEQKSEDNIKLKDINGYEQEYTHIATNNNRMLFQNINSSIKGGNNQKRKSKRNYSKKQRKQSKNDTLRNYFNYTN